MAEHRKHRGRPVFFHLDLRKEHVKSARLEEAILDGAQYFRGKIINIGLEFHDPFAGWCLCQITEDGAQYIWPAGQISGSESIANF